MGYFLLKISLLHRHFQGNFIVVEGPNPIIAPLLTASTVERANMPPGDNVEDIPFYCPLPTPHGCVLPPSAKPLSPAGITEDIHGKFTVTPALPLSRTTQLSGQSNPPPITAHDSPSVAPSMTVLTISDRLLRFQHRRLPPLPTKKKSRKLLPSLCPPVFGVPRVDHSIWDRLPYRQLRFL